MDRSTFLAYISGVPEFVITDRAALLSVLEAHHWMLSHAAKALGISRQTLYATMSRLKVKRRKPTGGAAAEFRRVRASRAAYARWRGAA